MKKILILFIVLIFSIGSFYFFYREGTLPVNKTVKTSKIFVVRKGEGLNSIAKELSNDGLIRSKIIFYLVVKQLSIEKNIQAGDFRLSPAMDAYQIAKILTHGTLDQWITVIEGLRKEEIAQLVSQNIGIPEVEFLKIAKEGYLFPDTYLIPKDATAGAVVDIFLANFNRKFNVALREKAKVNKLTDDEMITLASLVEREAHYDSDRKKVASVILKRLKNGSPLQIDATVQYALGYQSEQKSWWKKELSTDDLSVKSFYNTYKNTGLPPGPISNPGLASILAAIEADENTPYIFYVSDKTGHLHFAKTLEEHSENIRKYLSR